MTRRSLGWAYDLAIVRRMNAQERVNRKRLDRPDGPLVSDPARPGTEAMRRIGRNDPCPCGSGKKYKHYCGGVDAKEEARSRSELIREAARAYIEKKAKWRSIFSYGSAIGKKRSD
jgi:hypothetical protein